MPPSLKPLAQLSMLLSDMEQELGLEELSHFEKQVLLAIVDCTSGSDGAQLSEIQSHPLTKDVSRPSLYRSLKQLEQAGKIQKFIGMRGRYFVID